MPASTQKFSYGMVSPFMLWLTHFPSNQLSLGNLVEVLSSLISIVNRLKNAYIYFEIVLPYIFNLMCSHRNN
jgi:hypothetical protein